MNDVAILKIALINSIIPRITQFIVPYGSCLVDKYIVADNRPPEVTYRFIQNRTFDPFKQIVLI